MSNNFESGNAPSNSLLTPAARATLDEYLATERLRIIKEAQRLGSGGKLTPRDILNASEALEAQHEPEFDPYLADYLLVRSNRTSLLLYVFSATVMVIAGFALVFFLVQRDGLDESTRLVSVAIAAFGLSVGIASTATTIVERIRNRREEEARFFYRESRRIESFLDSETSPVENSPMFSSEDFTSRGRFLFQWGRLEDRLRTLAERALGFDTEIMADYPIGPLLDDLVRLHVIDSSMGDEIRSIIKVRNSVVHSARVSSAEVARYSRTMEDLERMLDMSIKAHTFRS